MEKKTIQTHKGVYFIFKVFVTEEEAEEYGYQWFFRDEMSGRDIYIHHFDRKNPYRVHFGMVA